MAEGAPRDAVRLRRIRGDTGAQDIVYRNAPSRAEQRIGERRDAGTERIGMSRRHQPIEQIHPSQGEIFKGPEKQTERLHAS